jgi:hypothetical protein
VKQDAVPLQRAARMLFCARTLDSGREMANLFSLCMQADDDSDLSVGHDACASETTASLQRRCSD